MSATTGEPSWPALVAKMPVPRPRRESINEPSVASYQRAGGPQLRLCAGLESARLELYDIELQLRVRGLLE